MNKYIASLLSAVTIAANDYADVHGEAYLKMSASEKSDVMWSNINVDTDSQKWMSVAKLTGLFTEGMGETFETIGDELPTSYLWGVREKYIHSVGNIAKAEWRVTGDHGYTGMFEGAKNCYARLSFAKEPNVKKANTTPGMGVKCLRDGMDSANFVAMYSIDGHESWDFFAVDFTNHIPAGSLALVPLEKKFSVYTPYVGEVGLSEMASYSEDGSAVDEPNFPFNLIFKSDLSTPADPPMDTGRLFTDDLKQIASGSVLYKVFAWDKPEELGGTMTQIAELVTTSEMTTSTWGDRHWFIRHQDMQDDLAIHPEWTQYTHKFGIFNSENEKEFEDHLAFHQALDEAGETVNEIASGCPYAMLWQ